MKMLCIAAFAVQVCFVVGIVSEIIIKKEVR